MLDWSWLGRNENLVCSSLEESDLLVGGYCSCRGTQAPTELSLDCRVGLNRGVVAEQT